MIMLRKNLEVLSQYSINQAILKRYFLAKDTDRSGSFLIRYPLSNDNSLTKKDSNTSKNTMGVV